MAYSPDTRGRAAEDESFPATALLLVDGQRNRELLRSALHTDVEILEGPEYVHDERVDMVVTDPDRADDHHEAIQSMRDRTAQVFLPVLLLVPSHGKSELGAEDWEIIDEVLPIPVRRQELKLRVRMLLRARHYSQVSASRYRRLQEEINAVRQQKEEFERLFTASGDPVLLTSQSGEILKANPAACGLLNVEGDELLGRHFKTFFEDQDLVETLCARLRDESSIENLEADMCRSDGTMFVGNISASSLGQRSQRTWACQFIIRDISEAKAHEQQLIAAREEAEEMNRLKSAFLANMSHEIRTPLASIIGYADLLLEQVPEALQSFIEVIHASGERLLTTLDSVLTLAQLQSGAMELCIEHADVSELAREVEESFRMQVEKKGLYLDVETPEEPVTGSVDQRAVFRILSQLVHNAVKFTCEGGITLSIEESGDKTACVLRVSDTGIGMDEELVPELFEAFRQASTGERRQYEGSGLGLTLVHELVTLFDGCVNIDSEIDAGTTVTVRIPWASTGNGAQQSSLHSAKQWGLDALPDGQHVLVVDDDPLVRDLLVEMLPKSYAIDTAKNAREALSYGENESYDLILLDINLKDTINGMDVHEQLRETETARDALIVAITAYAQDGDGERFHASGFDGYVPKPFTRETLFENLIQIFH